MKNRLGVIYLTLITFFVSCSKSIEVDQSSISLQIDKSIILKLDSVTPDYSHGIHLIETDSVDYISMLNDLNNTIYLYNIENRKLENKLTYHKGGKGIQNDIMYFLPHNRDSLFLFTHGLFSYLSNFEGELVDKYPTLDLSFRQSVYATNSSPLIFRNDQLFYNSIFFGNYDEEYQPLMCYDLKSNAVTTFGGLPPVYFEGNWGGFPYDYIYHVYDKNNDIIIYSFPAFNELVVYDFSSSLEYSSKTSFKSSLTPPFPKGKEVDENSLEWIRKINRTPIFGEIYYDNVNERFYRVYKYPASEAEVNKRNPLRKIALLSYSTDLEFLGEYILPEGYYFHTNNYFLYNDSIFIRVKVDSEDLIKFVSFKLFDL